jgi:hypothetical protein
MAVPAAGFAGLELLGLVPASVTFLLGLMAVQVVRPPVYPDSQ